MQQERRARGEELMREIQSMTLEEQKVFRSCMQTEAFFNSALPYALVSSAVGYATFSFGPYSRFAKYVAAGSGMVGFLIGKTAYGLTCLEKTVPRLRPLLKPEKYVSESVEQHNEMEQSPNTFSSQYRDQAVSGSDFGEPISSFDSYSSFNDSDSFNTVETDLTEPINLQRNVTYEELMRKNRAEYGVKSQRLSRDRPMVVREANESNPVDTGTVPSKRTKYGDVWE